MGGARASGMELAAHRPSHELRAGIADFVRLYSKERLPEALGCPAPEERSVAPIAKAAGSPVCWLHLFDTMPITVALRENPAILGMLLGLCLLGGCSG